MQSIDFSDFEPGVQQIKSDGTLVKCDYFDVKVLGGSKQAGVPGESLTIAVVSGKISLGGETLKAGDFALVPATLPNFARLVKPADAESQWLEIRIPA
jgi:hypothetical protein